MSNLLRWRWPFWRGAASVLDMGGVLVDHGRGLPPEYADALALYSDWRAVGDDIRTVVATSFDGHLTAGR